MRRYNSIIAAVALIALSACDDKDVTKSIHTGELMSMAFEVPAAKTVISEQPDQSAAVLWTAEDHVSIFDGTANRDFKAQSSGASTVLKGSANDVETFYAVYPYSSSNSLDGETLTAVVPSAQSVTGPGFAAGANVSVAKTTTSTLVFHNVCGLVRVNVPSGQTHLCSVKLEDASGADLAGEVAINCSSSTPAIVSTVSGSKSIVMSKLDSTPLDPGNYYIAVIPGTYTFKVTLMDDAGREVVRTASAPRTIEASHIRGIGSVDDDIFLFPVSIVLASDAALDLETSDAVYSGRLAAGSYTLDGTALPYVFKGDKGIYEAKNFAFEVVDNGSEDVQVFTITRSNLSARHILVRASSDASANGSLLSAALSSASSDIDDIYVGKGTFRGGFTMVDGVNVTGNWNDDFSSCSDYDPFSGASVPETVLDGGGQNRVLAQNSAFSEKTTWKNVKIVDGYVSSGNGAGAYLRSNGCLVGCEVRGCEAETGSSAGGGIWADASSIVSDSFIHDNFAQNSGGGVYSKGLVKYCVIKDNTAKDNVGGGIQLHGGSSASNENGTMYNCIVSGNTSVNGGGVRLYGNTQIANLLVAGNTATSGGVSGILVNGVSSIVNCTITGNHDAASSAGNSSALYCNQNGTIKNCIVVGNTASSLPASSSVQIYINHQYTWLKNNAVSAGGIKLHSNYDPNGNGRQTETRTVTTDVFTNFAGGDYTLSSGASQCIDGGNTSIFGFMTKDLAGKTRVVGTVDIGCYERQ